MPTHNRYRDPRGPKTRKEQEADAVETLLGFALSDRLFCEIRDGLTVEGFAELKKILARRHTAEREAT